MQRRGSIHTLDSRIREKLVCGSCHIELIDIKPNFIIVNYYQNTARVIGYQIRANKSRNIVRRSNTLYCVNNHCIGYVNNHRNLNFRFYLHPRSVIRAFTIYTF